jgi:LysR family transcriptional regulator, glycine cleavage system transcriptional activator
LLATIYLDCSGADNDVCPSNDVCYTYVMRRERRFLPSVSLLAAFEAVLRSGSTVGAAQDLNLSQSTVSRLVQNLEQQLGCVLFVRERRRLCPTDEARAYGRDVTRALDLIQRGGVKLVTNPGGGVLSLAVLPAFGARWLAPRLGDFLRTHEGTIVNIATRLKRFDFATESFDAAIHFGIADWRDAEHMKLFDERITACVAPALLARRPVKTAADVARLPLLQLETRTNAWAKWFASNHARAPDVRGMLFDQFATMTQAAVSALGVAVLPDYLADQEIEAGRLAPLFKRSVPGTGSYWLIWPKSRSDYPPLVAFREWLSRDSAVGNARRSDALKTKMV